MYCDLVEALGTATFRPEVVQRLVAVAPDLAKLLAGEEFTIFGKKRRDAAFHYVAAGVRIDTTGPGTIQGALKGPRLQLPKFGAERRVTRRTGRTAPPAPVLPPPKPAVLMQHSCLQAPQPTQTDGWRQATGSAPGSP
ncbi:unnamed protein product [Prorocentrum cordatum]|uniref:Uncharacterized protein n=1 Tax=Prorocentrum cordatum TaxID=2364126 RepID=A0ABN9YF88_9DINO|nr:unnamed protein product [Polarella glacialis]